MTHPALRLLGAGVLALALHAPALAEWPEKMVRIIVPHTPGGFNDSVSRLIAKELGERWGQSVVIENRPGAAQQIGTAAVAKAPADGYTLLNVAFSHGVNPSLYQLPYDTRQDFAPVAWLGSAPNVLVVNTDSPYHSVADVIAAAKAEPGKLTYGSAGPGSSPHLATELLAQSAGLELTHVPYKGGAPMATDLMGGQISLVLDNIPNLIPYIKADRLRGLAVSGTTRSPLAPELPTLQEAGVPGYEMLAWFGLVAPAGTPPEIVEKINADVEVILAKPEVQAWFAQQGVTPTGGSTAEFSAFIDGQIDKWAEVVKTSGITAQ